MMQESNKEHNPWTTLTSEQVYENPWIEVSHRNVLNPNGGKGIYGLVHFKNLAIGIVPLDAGGNTWLVGQYRYTLQAYSWEIPEGGCPEGQDPLEAARRELLEETGITATNWTRILHTHLSNSVTDEAGLVYIAQGLKMGPSQPEDTEKLEVQKLPLQDAVQMVLDGRITDSLSIMALLLTDRLLKDPEASINI